MLTYPIQTCDDSMDIPISIVCLPAHCRRDGKFFAEGRVSLAMATKLFCHSFCEGCKEQNDLGGNSSFLI